MYVLYNALGHTQVAMGAHVSWLWFTLLVMSHPDLP